MEVFVVVYKAKYHREDFDDVYVYDTFNKAKDCFEDLIDGWFNEKFFNVEKPTCEHIEWEEEDYWGTYHNDRKDAYLYIEETRSNTENYLSVRIERCNVM